MKYEEGARVGAALCPSPRLPCKARAEVGRNSYGVPSMDDCESRTRTLRCFFNAGGGVATRFRDDTIGLLSVLLFSGVVVLILLIAPALELREIDSIFFPNPEKFIDAAA